ncbi:DRMBL-domain-containing protein [Lichtheimia hyalospora FSU 10163]|nr:DRMBL-domain-containing protein [Lichtheimia hyalospora FSU 10163]
MVSTARTVKRTQVHSTQQRTKRQRDNNTPSLTLQHYFKRTSSLQSDSSNHNNIQQQSSFESDLERAIALSLAESASSYVTTSDNNEAAGLTLHHDDPGTAEIHADIAPNDTEGLVDDTIASNIKRELDDTEQLVEFDIKKEAADDPFRPIQNDIISSMNDEKVVDSTDQQCPVCRASIKAESIDIMNEHINRCLDGSLTKKEEEEDSKSNTMTTSDTPNKDTKSWFQTVENAIRGVFDPKANNNAINNSRAAQSSNNKPSSSTTKGKQKRTCPFYKWVKDTTYVVDAFTYGKIPDCSGYFLSHFHSDHYGYLGKKWSHGTVYCSQITANLLHQRLGVSRRYVCVLPMDVKYPLSDTVNVSLIDANHCPGAVLFLFEILRPDGVVVRHLHTGDFRATPSMCLHPLIRQPTNPPIDTLYLDTTYLDDRYTFPIQEDVVHAACDVAYEQCFGQPVQQQLQWKPAATASNSSALVGWLQSSQKPKAQLVTDESEGTLASIEKTKERPLSKVLVVVGTYTIGKEKVFLNIAKRLGSKIYVNEKKRKILVCQENNELDSLLVTNPHQAQVHVLPLGTLKIDLLESYLKSMRPHFTSLIAFLPTAQTFRPYGSPTIGPPLSDLIEQPMNRSIALKPTRASTDTVKLYHIPYSEHSSFRELAAFICSLEIRRIIPTVNNRDDAVRQLMYAVLDRWQQEKKKQNLSSIVPYQSENYW